MGQEGDEIGTGDPVLDGNPYADSEAWSIPRMRWRELEKLVAAGWAIGAHTRTHWFLTTIPEGPEGDEHIRYELTRGKADIEENLGVPAEDFAYPNSMWNDRIEGMVRDVYRTARHCRMFGQAEYITRRTDPYRLPTMNVSYLLPFEDYPRLVCRTDPGYVYYRETCAVGNSPSQS